MTKRSDSDHNSDAHFSRSQKFIDCYRMIGGALLDYERAHSGLGSVLTLSHFSTPFPVPLDLGSFFKKSKSSFESGVAFVPVEFLEAYLEDVLDLKSKDEDLYIVTARKFPWSAWVAILGLAFSISVGLYAVSLGYSLIASFALTAMLALPFGILWHFSPRDKISRRMLFAKLLQNEISRRRGDTGPFVATPLRSISGGRLFTKPTMGSARNLI